LGDPDVSRESLSPGPITSPHDAYDIGVAGDTARNVAQTRTNVLMPSASKFWTMGSGNAGNNGISSSDWI